MKAITITITEELDTAAAAEARRRGVSKSELIRLGLVAVLTSPPPPGEGNPWRKLAGFGNPRLTVEQEEIDDTVYQP